MWLYILTPLVCATSALWVYVKLTCGKCQCTRRLDGQTVIVTGANTGIGKETARRLAKHGARVILACRDMKKAEIARDDIIASTGNENVVVHKLDLSSLQSVREFAQKIRETEPNVHILVNNAGLVGASKITRDGLELTMQVNHFGPFLLTLLLLDIVKKSVPSRIIMVSSVAHYQGKLNLQELNIVHKQKKYFQIYGNSKLCNILMANELGRRLAGTGVAVNSLHPGAVMTEIWRKLPNWQLTLLKSLASLYFKDSVQGAQTTIHLALSEKLASVSGQYFVDCKIAKQSPAAQDQELARRLWDISVKCVGLEDHDICVKCTSTL